MKPEDFNSLTEKLEYLESKGVVFRAGYRGMNEVITAVMPDGTFVDWHWLESNEDGTDQWFKPLQFEEMVDEVLEITDERGFIEEGLDDRLDELRDRYGKEDDDGEGG